LIHKNYNNYVLLKTWYVVELHLYQISQMIYVFKCIPKKISYAALKNYYDL